MRKTPNATGTGKGGDFQTRRNPFTEKAGTGNRPAFADNTDIGMALDAILRSECAVIIGCTRDGGALVLTILDGEERHRTYCSNDGELSAALHMILVLYNQD